MGERSQVLTTTTQGRVVDGSAALLRDFHVWTRAVQQNTKQAFYELGFMIHQAVKARTPVAGQGEWDPPQKYLDEGGGGRAREAWEINFGGLAITIENAVVDREGRAFSYISALERGWSPQDPEGMLMITMEEARLAVLAGMGVSSRGVNFEALKSHFALENLSYHASVRRQNPDDTILHFSIKKGTNPFPH